MNTMSETEFQKLSTFEEMKAVQINRANRSNLQCLIDIFGSEVPQSATAFHTEDLKAVFLDTKQQNWSVPVKEIKLDQKLIHELRMVGMLGTFGWELHSSGSLMQIADKTLAETESN